MRAALASIGDNERAVAGAELIKHVTGMPEYQAADIVMCFVPLDTEVPTKGLMAQVITDGKILAVPALQSNRLTATRLSNMSALGSPDDRGLRQPETIDAVNLGSNDLVLVPGLAFDTMGYRLGRGGGHYDRFLAATPGYSAGVAFAVQIVDKVPRERHDVPVNHVIQVS